MHTFLDNFHKFGKSVYLLVRPPRPRSLSFIGWWSYNPRTAAKKGSRLCPFFLVYYVSRQRWFRSPLIPPPRFTRFPFPPVPFARILSLPFYFLLSVRFCVVVRPPPAASGHPSSVRRKSTTLWVTADQMPFSWCPVQRPI